MNIAMLVHTAATRKPQRLRDHPQRGFAYLFLLFALAVIGLLLGTFAQNWSTTTQREREADLIFIGKQFSAALTSYRTRTPSGPTAPATLEELLEDKRFPFPVRHLRQIFRDPMTGKRDWDLQLADGHIVGIRSHSQKQTLRHTLPDYVVISSDTGESVSYHDWLFIASKNNPPAAAENSAPIANAP